MEDLNQLSNEELKYRLTQFGFANLPVTSTTRKVLIKKLRNQMENEKSKLKRETSYATRYSSDEDHSDADTTTSSVRKRTAPLSRSTISTTTPTSSILSNRTNDGNLTMPPPLTNPLSATKRTTTTTTTNWDSPSRNTQYSSQYGGSSPSKPKDLIYISPLIQSADRNGNESDEESDSNVNNASSMSNRYSGNLSMNISSRASIGGASSASSASSAASSSGSGSGSGSSNGIGNFADLDNTHYLGYGGIRNRFYNPVLDEHDNSAQSTTTPTTNGVHDHDDTSNQTADFTKRLMSFRNRNLGSTINPPSTMDTGERCIILKSFFFFFWYLFNSNNIIFLFLFEQSNDLIDIHHQLHLHQHEHHIISMIQPHDCQIYHETASFIKHVTVIVIQDYHKLVKMIEIIHYQ